METLQGLISRTTSRIRFLTPEEEAEMAEAERARMRAESVKRARIPVRYQNAALDDVSEHEIVKYAELVTLGGAGLAKNGPWMVISGPNGTGKTHAACAVLNEVVEYPVKFARMGQMLGEMSESFGSRESTESIVRRYGSYRLLVIDDFGKEKPTEWNVSQFFRVLCDRYDAMRPTIITTNYSSAQLVEYLTVNGNADAARAIMDRICDAGNVFVRTKGGSMRRERVPGADDAAR